MSKIGLEIDAIVFDSTFDHIQAADLTEETVFDPFAKLLENGALAAAIGGARPHEHVAALREETAEADARFRKLSPDWPNPWRAALSKSADELDQPLTDDSHVLEKSGSRRSRALREWMRSELSKGETVKGLVAYAARTDPAYARLLQEIGDELEA